MKYKKGSAAVWAIVPLIVVIIVGAAYWYLTQNPAQSTTTSTTDLQTQQTPQQTTATQQTNSQPAPSQTSAYQASTNNQQSQSAQASQTFSASPTSGAAPLTVTFSNLPVTAAEVDLNFGDGTPEASDGYNGCWPVNGKVQNPCTKPEPGTVTHTYTKAGTYTTTVTGEMSEGVLGTATITVQ